MFVLPLLLILAQDVDILLERLGSEALVERKRAVERLAALGRKARPGLEKAAQGPNPEVAARAREALELMRWPLGPRERAMAPAIEKAVGDGLRWLEAHPPNDAALKALVELAFLGAGRVRLEAVDVLAEAEFGGEKPNYGRALTTLVLAEAHGLVDHERYRGDAERAVELLQAARNPGKGWRYAPRDGQTDGSVTFWAGLALWTAQRVGLEVDAHALTDARRWFQEATDETYGLVGYTGRPFCKLRVRGEDEPETHVSMTAHAVAFHRLFRGRDPVRGAGLVAQDWPRTDAKAVDFYFWHAGALALDGLREGAGWREELVKVLTALQKADGSWDPTDRWGVEPGRAYSTSMALLALQAPRLYRLNPLVR